MQRLLEFIGHHPYLTGGALLAAVMVAIYETRERLQAFAGVSTMQAVQLINQGALVLDLRAREAFDAGHIGEARSVPAAELGAQIESLQKWRDKPVLVYCDSGVTSAGAARTLMKNGFTRICNLDGGMNAWVKDNLPLARAAAGRKAGPK